MSDLPGDTVPSTDEQLAPGKGAAIVVSRHALDAESAPALLALYSAIVEALRGRGVVRSTSNPVGDYAEYLVARAFDLSLVGNSSIGYDAISRDGVRYQVKSRRLTARNRSRQLGFFRGFQLSDDPFDLLVAVLFNEDFTIQRAALIPVSIVRQHAARVEYVNAWRLILRDSVWAIPGVEDVTDRIRVVAGAAPLPRPAPASELPVVRQPRPPVKASPGARVLQPKADPREVRAYFASTGLSRREIGAIVGTGVGVIATIQNPNGDRWSTERFERARALIDAYVAKRAAGRAETDGGPDDPGGQKQAM